MGERLRALVRFLREHPLQWLVPLLLLLVLALLVARAGLGAAQPFLYDLR